MKAISALNQNMNHKSHKQEKWTLHIALSIDRFCSACAREYSSMRVRELNILNQAAMIHNNWNELSVASALLRALGQLSRILTGIERSLEWNDIYCTIRML